jgi:hypothetical protein
MADTPDVEQRINAITNEVARLKIKAVQEADGVTITQGNSNIFLPFETKTQLSRKSVR